MNSEFNETGNDHYKEELRAEITGLEKTTNDLYTKIGQLWEEKYDPTQPVKEQMKENPELGGLGKAAYSFYKDLEKKRLELGDKYLPSTPTTPAEREAAYIASENKIIALRAYQSLLSSELDDYYANVPFALRGVTTPESNQKAIRIGELTDQIERAQQVRNDRKRDLQANDSSSESLLKKHYLEGDEA